MNVMIHLSDGYIDRIIIRAGLRAIKARTVKYSLRSCDNGFNDARFEFGPRVALLYSDRTAIPYAHGKKEKEMKIISY